MWILRGCELSFYTRLPLSCDCCVNDRHDAGQDTSEDNNEEEEKGEEEEGTCARKDTEIR